MRTIDAIQRCHFLETAYSKGLLKSRGRGTPVCNFSSGEVGRCSLYKYINIQYDDKSYRLYDLCTK